MDLYGTKEEEISGCDTNAKLVNRYMLVWLYSWTEYHQLYVSAMTDRKDGPNYKINFYLK